MNVGILKNCRILIVKSDLSAEGELRRALSACGADILGVVDDLPSALNLIAEEGIPDGAILDVDFQAETVWPMVEQITKLKIPFVFSTASLAATSGPGLQADIEQVITPLALRISRRGAAQVPLDESAKQASGNKLLQMMPPDIYKVLAPHLRRVELKPREILIREHRIIPAVWFPETAVASMVVATEGVRPIEVGMIGCEGMTDLVLNADERSMLRSSVLIPGDAMMIEAEPFAAAMAHPGFDRFVLAYKQALAVQFAFAALSHGTSTIDARLARWILMLDDRLEGGSIPVVHNHIADLLAVRRSGVTTALHVLEGMGAIKSVRGMILVRDRSVLMQLAGGVYGPPEAEYQRLMARVKRRFAPESPAPESGG